MKADWDKLGAKFADSDNVIIVDVDCTADGASACQTHGVKGYPTIQYFKAGQKKGTAYTGGRDYSSLLQFVKTTLDKEVANCDVATGKGCKPIEVKFIEKMKDLSAEDLKAERKRRETEHKEAKKEFEAVQKEWKKTLKKHKLATSLLKKMEKQAAQ